MSLIDDWRRAWRFLVVIGAAVLGALNFLADHADLFTPDVAAALAQVLSPAVMGAINRWSPLVLILLRVIRQPNAAPAAPAPADPAMPPT